MGRVVPWKAKEERISTRKAQQHLSRVKPIENSKHKTSSSGLCYFVSSSKLTWIASLAECSAKDGRLANPKTWDEWRTIIPKPTENYWTGNDPRSLVQQFYTLVAHW